MMEKEQPEVTSTFEYLRPEKAARYLNISASKLAKMRMIGAIDRGPIYSKVGGCIVYERSNLDTWIQEHSVGRSQDQSTFDD